MPNHLSPDATTLVRILKKTDNGQLSPIELCRYAHKHDFSKTKAVKELVSKGRVRKRKGGRGIILIGRKKKKERGR
jgi:hypothetical protein